MESSIEGERTQGTNNTKVFAKEDDRHLQQTRKDVALLSPFLHFHLGVGIVRR
jgi:hypothetical protein